MKYKQGRSFPPTAQGAGLIFMVVGILTFYMSNNYLLLLLCYPSLWIMFSTASLNTKRINEGIIVRTFGFFPLIFSRKIKLSNYDAGLIKVERVKYRTTQSTGFVELSSQETPDEFMALSLKIKRKYEFDVLFKGNREEINAFIKANLLDSGFRFFNGVLKPEFEIKFEAE